MQLENNILVKLKNELSAQPDGLLSAIKIADSLFEKASLEYLTRKTIDELKNIVNNSHTTLKTLGNNSEPCTIIEFNAHSGALWVAQGDRPFIVNTLSETIRSLGGQIIACLHPIILDENQRISLTYIEFNGISEDKKELITEQILYKSQLLETVTGDYSDILFEIEKIAFSLDKKSDLRDFLNWLSDGCFVFLGLTIVDKSLGLFKDQYFYKEIFARITSGTQAINLFKLNILSPIHRKSPMLCFEIPELKLNILGLFTSKALGLQSSSIPVIKKKLKLLLEQENVLDNSYDYGNIVDIIDSMPKDELFNISVEDLQHNIRTIQGFQDSNTSKVSIRFDSAKKGISCLVLIPKDSFNAKVRDQIQKLLEHEFSGKDSQYHLDFTDVTHARLYFYIPSSVTLNMNVDLIKIQESINKITSNWVNQLQILSEKKELANFFNDIRAGIPERYKESTTTSQGIIDLNFLSKSSENSVFADIQKADEQSVFSIYSTKPLSLSKIMPTLENIGLEVISEDFFKIKSKTADFYIQRFKVNVPDSFNFENFSKEISTNFESILSGKFSDCSLLKLCAYTNMEIKSVMLLKAYSDYFWQINKFATRASIFTTLAAHPEVSSLLWELFDNKFNPNKDNLSDNSQVHKALKTVQNSTADRIFRIILDLINNTIRTNYYFFDDGIAIKIDAAQAESVPSPKPMYEIYVSSPDFEGVHLRSSKVSRGGIRWSDRLQDFRTEILGLMRTQKIKNSLIVAEGAKGGFIVKDQTKSGKEYFELGKNIYRRYVRNLLSLSDNLIDGKIARNPKLVIYDTDDSYFVVAADKGTATFSDTANEIAVREYNFWLGDAFASGGSKGYDHKKYGITAKGAWKCVERHFKDLGIDYQNSSFSAVGIGDMSGDVFGNGLIISDKIKLLAAFNHKHIFIDPNPEPKKSYEERLRLFKTPGSQWTDYQGLSTGGYVYDRNEREINLSAEACASLVVPFPQKVSSEELVSIILKAPVDLLWNGGIGTYIKASSEQNANVNDGTNDLVRINANEVRAKVIGEGGNLGLTQKGRIEFAQLGGAINTDAIDNSAGVDLSDHEVNLKILFADLIKNNKITVEERDKILLNIADDVCEQVLNHNASHALILTIGKLRSVFNNPYLSSLITLISNQGFINRRAEELPEDQELENRLEDNTGLLRPELAVLLAGTKLQIKKAIKNSGLLKDTYLDKYLLNYFPSELRNKFTEEIKKHKLRDDIIATELTNHLLDAVGITFIHRMCLNYQVDIAAVVKCTVMAVEILDSTELREIFSRYDEAGSVDKFLHLCHELGKATRDLTAWLVKIQADQRELAEVISLYSTAFNNVVSENFNLIFDNFTDLAEKQAALGEFKFENCTLRKLVLFNKITLCFEIIHGSFKFKQNFKDLFASYKNLNSQTHFESLVNAGLSLRNLSKWDNELLLTTIDQIWHAISELSQKKDLDFKAVKLLTSELTRNMSSVSGLYVYAKTLHKLI